MGKGKEDESDGDGDEEMGEDEQDEGMSEEDEEGGDNNCCVQLYFQSDQTTLQEQIAIEVIGDIIEQDFFDDLRTK